MNLVHAILGPCRCQGCGETVCWIRDEDDRLTLMGAGGGLHECRWLERPFDIHSPTSRSDKREGSSWTDTLRVVDETPDTGSVQATSTGGPS